MQQAVLYLRVKFGLLKLVFFSIGRWRHANMLAKHPVELREAVETTGGSHLRDGDLGVDQKRLNIADPGHLQIVSDGESGYLFELMGKVTGADSKNLGQHIQRQIFGVVHVDIIGDGIHLFLDFRHFGFVGILVLLPIQI